MSLDEVKISRAIISRYMSKLSEYLELDAAIVGAGPSGLIAALKLAEKGHKVALFERKLSIGGGMWGGGMMFNEIVLQEEGAAILKELGIRVEDVGDGYYTSDSVECVTTLASLACKAGAKLFNLITVEDVMVRDNRVTGLVINWTAVDMAGLHIDPLAVRAKYVIEATGHPTEVLKVVQRKMGARLLTETGAIMGERSMWAEVAENTTLDNTKEAFPGIFVAGMAANATFGSFRMGPIFGGMLLSGQKVAELVDERLKA
ncbi:MAG: sulfide-dependent adenosine diphosphate thiazole synthase [Dissulfurimicrobium sp.]|uniref:sulfide-dependent adenosine diphosphate thiazole synthase n=1 Tax=Dissulfurimicrobium TaxID=1769732 RepID=UPI001EDA6E69|nr:sulfide-dependent adenosine diphosphate thiazole synthase [Dissulfurimicrobium hydrothermale]UKL13600.1 sulfide-dependent adenosine diphosphate thiazole synthase [Dissulfurimicrobium hydrothermale]